MYIRIQDKNGEMVVQKNMRAHLEAFLKSIRLYQKDIVAAVECMFALDNPYHCQWSVV